MTASHICPRDDTKVANQASWLEEAFVFFAFIVYGGAMVSPIRILRGAGPLQVGLSDPFNAACQFFILGVLGFVVIVRWRRVLPLLTKIVPCLLIVALCMVSFLWSDYHEATLRRSTNLGVCIIFGVYCYDTFGMAKLIDIVGRVAVFLAIISLFAYVIAPDIGREPTVETYSDALRGVFSQKNGMAEFMLLGISCCSYRLLNTGRISAFLLSVVLLYGCIILGRSVSALLIATVVLIATGWFFLYGHPRARIVLAFVVGSLAIFVVAAAILMPAEAFLALGRDESLTGRLPLWRVVIAAILDHPLLGYGYSGFWVVGSREMEYVWLRAGWPAPDAHNGYLDIMLQIGVFGVVLYAWLWTNIIRLAAKAWRLERSPVAAWILLLMLINVLTNLDEGPMPWADQFTALMPGTLIALTLWNAQRHQQNVPVTRKVMQAFGLDQSA